MEYNTKRNKLVIPEYGRNVQKMVEYDISIKDKEKRNELARLIVRIMTQMHISSGSYGDYTHKIWDHLFIISDFLLDVDSPYPLPDKSKIEKDPEPIEYSDGKIKHKTYGRNLQKIIQKAIEWEEGEEKEALVKLIANNLKKAYLNWNSLSVDDEQIKKDLDKLSGGKLKLPDDYVFPSTYELVGKKKNYSKENRGSQNRGGQNRGKKSNRNDNRSNRNNSSNYKRRSY